MSVIPPPALHPRKAPQQARSAITVDAVLEGTVQVLLALGSARLNTTRVAERAGVSVGTLYQYFPNKQALLYAVLERHVAALADAVEAACDAHRGAALGAMAEAVVAAYVRAKTGQCDASRALHLIAVELDARGPVEAATRRGEDAVAAMLATARDGRFPDPQAVARALLAAVQGTVRAFYERDLPPETSGEAERQLALMCRAYLAAASGAA